MSVPQGFYKYSSGSTVPDLRHLFFWGEGGGVKGLNSGFRFSGLG